MADACTKTSIHQLKVFPGLRAHIARSTRQMSIWPDPCERSSSFKAFCVRSRHTHH